MRVGFIRRFGQGVLPNADMVLQAGDLLYLLSPSTRLEEIERILSCEPVKEEN
ncbi:MAG: TrkA C-terminal domain-containing protein [Bifidobacteriaceae bacterium]|nr:TrkA C-terminal domain-containing protein [Bifidobacteriaceae bacterium]